MRRYAILAAAVVMQMCLGATYSWSVYVAPLRELTGLMQGTVQIPFTLFYFVFPATMIVAGSLLPRLGPRRCAMGGGLVFGGGWMLAGLGHHHFAFTVLGIGAMAGIGVGFAYIVPIATCIRWFPDRKGLVTGVAVAGFGGGAAAVSQIGGHLMAHWSVSPFATFVMLGAGFVVLVTAAGALMAFPPSDDGSARALLPLGDVAGQRLFWLLYLAMFAGLSAGFAVNANLKELHAAGTAGTGVAAVSLFALANAAGRIVWGGIFDRMSARRAIRANLSIQAAVLFFSPMILAAPAGLLVFSLLTGFNYGGVLVIYVSSAARCWGAGHVGQVYGWLFSANIPAAVAPILAGFTYDLTGGFYPALAAIAGLIVVAVLMAGALGREPGGAPLTKTPCRSAK